MGYILGGWEPNRLIVGVSEEELIGVNTHLAFYTDRMAEGFVCPSRLQRNCFAKEE
ncbi:hypothetical protein PVOR_19354 [Paenibacillus vortex V453]|uniref:Uncharacterized protein n=1 Tax=Paenibacillus vortex V453 TaxID=715225 RepID=A0A2R9SSX0_9BACL|nr:hypothetical protein PVOR_19354 [Paenibacillus vortex V453]